MNVVSAAEMQAVGARLAAACTDGGWIYLHGELGTGKTTLVRGFLRGLGYGGAVKSPTFTLLEPYDINGRVIRHFDLYRLNDPQELEYLGIRDFQDPEAITLVEWPERGQGGLPAADVYVYIEYGPGDNRRVWFKAESERGKALLARAGWASGEAET